MGVKWTREQMAGTKAGETLFGDYTKSEKKNAKTARSRQATNEFTTWVVNYLNDSKEFVVWRNNNTPSTRAETIIKADGMSETKFHFKKGMIKVATLDIIGYRLLDGRHVEIEIKTGTDSLSKDQSYHLERLQKAGSVSFVARNREQFKLQIQPFLKPYKPAF